MLISAVPAFVFLLILGAVFGAVGARVRRRFGRRPLIPLWLGLAALVSGAMIVRGTGVERGMRYQPWGQHPLWMFVLYAAFLVLTLAPAALMLGRANERATAVMAGRAALLVVPGLVLALLVLLALDIAGIDFLPPR